MYAPKVTISPWPKFSTPDDLNGMTIANATSA